MVPKNRLREAGDIRKLANGHSTANSTSTTDKQIAAWSRSTFNHVTRRSPNGVMQVEREPIPALPAELAAIIKEMQS